MSNEPLGLPRGSVRALIALVLLVTTCFIFVTNRPVPPELLIIDQTALVYYFIKRDNEGPAEPPVPEPLIPGDEDG